MSKKSAAVTQIIGIAEHFQVSVKDVLNGAKDEDFVDVVVIGRDKNGHLHVAASHSGNETLKDIDEAKRRILSGRWLWCDAEKAA